MRTSWDGDSDRPCATIRRKSASSLRGASPRAAQGEGGAHDDRQADLPSDRLGLRDRAGAPGPRDLGPDLQHRRLEEVAVLGQPHRVLVGADQAHVPLFEHAPLGQRERQVDGGLAPDGRQDGVGPLAVDDPLEKLGRQGLDVRRVGELRVRHDRGGVGVDEQDPVSLAPQGAHGLRPGVVELARLADDDRPRPDDEDALDVVALRHRGRSIAVRFPISDSDFGSRAEAAVVARDASGRPPRHRAAAAVEERAALAEAEQPLADPVDAQEIVGRSGLALRPDGGRRRSRRRGRLLRRPGREPRSRSPRRTGGRARPIPRPSARRPRSSAPVRARRRPETPSRSRSRRRGGSRRRPAPSTPIRPRSTRSADQSPPTATSGIPRARSRRASAAPGGAARPRRAVGARQDHAADPTARNRLPSQRTPYRTPSTPEIRGSTSSRPDSSRSSRPLRRRRRRGRWRPRRGASGRCPSPAEPTVRRPGSRRSCPPLPRRRTSCRSRPHPKGRARSRGAVRPVLASALERITPRLPTATAPSGPTATP